MKDTDNFCYAKKAITCLVYLQFDIFAFSNDEWNTKDTGESLKNVLRMLQYTKRHLLGEAMSNSGILAIINILYACLTLKASVSQSVLQSVD